MGEKSGYLDSKTPSKSGKRLRKKSPLKISKTLHKFTLSLQNWRFCGLM
ncbi:hypothetical protein [Haemophilus pittmaniae]|nr:hypothetical protein [Haemophilus pittmaniae]